MVTADRMVSTERSEVSGEQPCGEHRELDVSGERVVYSLKVNDSLESLRMLVRSVGPERGRE